MISGINLFSFNISRSIDAQIETDICLFVVAHSTHLNTMNKLIRNQCIYRPKPIENKDIVILLSCMSVGGNTYF